MNTPTALVKPDARLTPDYLPEVDPAAVEQALLIGDLSQMTDAVRIAYYVATCRSLGLNPLTRPFQALQGEDGKVFLYPDKGCAEQLRKRHRVSVHVLRREILDDLYIVTVLATTPDGREEEAQGIVPIAKAKGTWEDYDYRGAKKRRFKPALDADGREIMLPLSPSERATAMMRGETKAKRRVTLAICGLGLPDVDPEDEGRMAPFPLDLRRALAEREPEKSTADHCANLYGDDTGKGFRDDSMAPARPAAGARTDSQPPGVSTSSHPAGSETGDVEPPSPQQRGGASLRRRIDELHQVAGRDDTWLARYWAKMCGRYVVDCPEHLPLSTLQTLLTEVRAFYAPQPPQSAQAVTSTPRTLPGTPPPPEGLLDDPGGPQPQSQEPQEPSDWRTRLAALLPQLQDAGLAREAQSLLEDADASDGAGQHMLGRVLWTVEDPTAAGRQEG